MPFAWMICCSSLSGSGLISPGRSQSARWVGEEEWHPNQKLTALPDGGIRLEVPYSQPQEILMDILRHGPHVEVVQPASLRSAVADQHRQAAQKYDLPKRSVASARSTTSSRKARALS
jgi:hypothetical protein